MASDNQICTTHPSLPGIDRNAARLTGSLRSESPTRDLTSQESPAQQKRYRPPGHDGRPDIRLYHRVLVEHRIVRGRIRARGPAVRHGVAGFASQDPVLPTAHHLGAASPNVQACGLHDRRRRAWRSRWWTSRGGPGREDSAPACCRGISSASAAHRRQNVGEPGAKFWHRGRRVSIRRWPLRSGSESRPHTGPG
jgi:hypothetical protein